MQIYTGVQWVIYFSKKGGKKEIFKDFFATFKNQNNYIYHI